MKYQVICVNVLTGISKEKQIPFAMHRCSVLDEFNQVESKNYQNRGLGLAAVELAVSEQFYDSLEREFDRQYKGAPVSMELKTRLDREGKNVVSGFYTATPSVSLVPDLDSKPEPKSSFAPK